MKPDPHEPTPAEWKVLTVVRERGPLATRDVVDAVAGESWSSSTIKTLLRRLSDKGLLESRRIGNGFVYSATRSSWQSLRRAGEQLLERAGETAVGPLLAYLVEHSRLSEQDLDELRALIEERSKEESS